MCAGFRTTASPPSRTPTPPRGSADMKFTLSWLKDHLDTDASIGRVADAMTMAGLEVEEVIDTGSRLAAFSVARIIEAVKHPNADRLRVCQVDTVDGRKEI